MTPPVIDPIFTVHKLNDDGLKRAEIIADHFNHLLTKLTEVVPTSSLEWGIVKNKLEEACFYAKKGMANDTHNQVPGWGAGKGVGT